MRRQATLGTIVDWTVARAITEQHCTATIRQKEAT